MTRVDFYVSNNSTEKAQSQLACRLAEKAYSLKHKIYIHTNSQEETEHLDRFMWLYSAGSFLPHCPYGAKSMAETPIIIGHDHAPEQDTDILINLSAQVPAFYSRFDRVVELVSGNETTRQQAREHYKHYRDRGYQVTTHNLSD